MDKPAGKNSRKPGPICFAEAEALVADLQKAASKDDAVAARPSDNPYLEAERQADLARKQAGAPAALPLANGEGGAHSVAFFTFIDIDQLRRIALVLATGDLPAEDCEMILASLPVELQEEFRRIVGRHRRYRYRAYGPLVLSSEDREKLVTALDTLRDTRSKMPTHTDTWSREEWKRLDHVMKLRRSVFPPSAVQRIEAAPGGAGLAAPNVAVMDGSPSPGYVRGLWKRLDEWGARRHDVSLATFRSWRTRQWKESSIGRPPHRGRARRVRDN